MLFEGETPLANTIYFNDTLLVDETSNTAVAGSAFLDETIIDTLID